MATKRSQEKQYAKSEATAEGVLLYTAYQLRGITYLPHFHERCYVKPGYGREHWETYLGAELKAMGAQPVELALWRRSAF